LARLALCFGGDEIDYQGVELSNGKTRKGVLMMKTQWTRFASAMFVVLFAFQASYAAIIKLDLAGPLNLPGPDIHWSGSALSTIPDGSGPLGSGSQSTNIIYGDFLSFLGTTTGAYSLHNLTVAGPALPGPFPGQVTQPLSGGSFQIWQTGNNVTPLLDVDLSNPSLSALTGFVGSTSGAVITVNNAHVQGGSLQPLIAANSISFSISLSNISGGLTLGGGGDTINQFDASATKDISGNPAPIPEPSVALLAAIGLWCIPAVTRRKR
jgi:hypothetical protein